MTIVIRSILLPSMMAAFALLAVLASATAAPVSALYSIRSDHWSDTDEKDYSTFIAAIGESDCATLDECLHASANPFRDTDTPGHHFQSDCAELPYLLRFYFAWKRGLPFSYADAMSPNGGSRDIRYSRNGNLVSSRRDLPSGRLTGYQIMAEIRAGVSTANYRVHPNTDGPLAPDFYSPAIRASSIRPGTVLYDPAGHVALVYRVDPDGQVHSFDAHTDFSLTTITFDVRFARTRPAQGAGFKNWRPLRLAGATRLTDGTLKGGHMVLAGNAAIADFSDEQFYGTANRPAEESWASGRFAVDGEALGYYDFVRTRLARGGLMFEPVEEISQMAESICSDLQYRAAAVDLAKPLAAKPHPARLPTNIYGSDGDWEMYSSPSRDARLKTVFVHLRNTAQRFVEMAKKNDTRHLNYAGDDLARDLLRAYRQAAGKCTLRYRRSNGAIILLSYEEARRRLFAMSFDPYHCPERRWGASDPAELSSCRDGADKIAWYDAEQGLRNQIERTYDARMDFNLRDLQAVRKTVTAPPDTDVAAYLQSQIKPSME